MRNRLQMWAMAREGLIVLGLTIAASAVIAGWCVVLYLYV